MQTQEGARQWQAKLVSAAVCVSCSFGSAKQLDALVVLSCCGSGWKKNGCPWKPAPLVPHCSLLRDSNAMESACVLLPCVCYVTYCQVKRILKSWPDQRHELQVSHTKSNLSLQGLHKMHGNQSKILALRLCLFQASEAGQHFWLFDNFFLWRRWDETHWNYGWAGAREGPCCSKRQCQCSHHWCQHTLRADKCWLQRGTLKTAERIQVLHNHKYLIPIIACWELQHCLQNTVKHSSVKHSSVKHISNANTL